MCDGVALTLSFNGIVVEFAYKRNLGRLLTISANEKPTELAPR
jgi:hypothetical protein